MMVSIKKLLKKNKKTIAISSTIQLAFFISFITVYFVIVLKIFDILVKITESMKVLQALGADINEQAAVFEALAKSTDFFVLYDDLIKWVVLLAVSAFFIWIIFQTFNFYLISKIFKKIKFKNYAGKFALFSFISYILIVASVWFSFYLSSVNLKLPLSFIPEQVPRLFIAIFLIIISYFSFFAFYLIIKNSISKAFLSLRLLFTKKTFLAFFNTFVIYILIVAFLVVFYRIHISLFYLYTILIFLPFQPIALILYFKQLE